MAERSRILNDLVRFWWLLAATTLVGIGAGVLYAVLAPTTYTAQAYVLVAPESPGAATEPTGFAQAYGRVVDQPQIIGAAAAELGVPPGELAERVQGQSSPDSPILEVSASAHTAAQSARAANTVAERLVAFGNNRTEGTSVALSVFSTAAAPPEPAAPTPPLDIAVGAAAGLLLGGLAVLAGLGDILAARYRLPAWAGGRAGNDRARSGARAGLGTTGTPNAHTTQRLKPVHTPNKRRRR